MFSSLSFHLILFYVSSHRPPFFPAAAIPPPSENCWRGRQKLLLRLYVAAFILTAAVHTSTTVNRLSSSTGLVAPFESRPSGRADLFPNRSLSFYLSLLPSFPVGRREVVTQCVFCVSCAACVRESFRGNFWFVFTSLFLTSFVSAAEALQGLKSRATTTTTRSCVSVRVLQNTRLFRLTDLVKWWPSWSRPTQGRRRPVPNRSKEPWKSSRSSKGASD